MIQRLFLALSTVILCGYEITTIHAAEGRSPSAYVDTSNGPAKTIAEYNLFKDSKHQIPNDGVIPYTVNTPHFADYAELHRFLLLPPETSITYRADHTLDYPQGTVVILTVGYLHDITDPTQGERLVETRLLVKGEEDWDSYHYIWNEEMTDARLALAGGKMPVSWKHYDGSTRAIDVFVPNRNQCSMCHTANGKFTPLGPMKARHLNRKFVYETGEANQLSHWSELGFLKGAPTDPNKIPRTPVWNDPATGTLNERARAYLDMNCASCHQPGGTAWTSGLDLTYEQNDPIRYGIYKHPVAAGRGVGDAEFGILPGKPDDSILYQRLRSTDPGVRMPVVGRGLVHDEGLALIREWIEQMDSPKKMVSQEAEINTVHRKQQEWLRSNADTPSLNSNTGD